MTQPPKEIPVEFWESRFQEGRTPWERGALNPAFLAWREAGALPPCRILIPGAGRSPEPAAMLSQGFDVTTLDLAESAVAFQSEKLGPDRAIQGDATRWTTENAFDVVYDQTCLCALPPALWPAYEANIRRWVRPGGALFVLFMQTGKEGGPPFDCPLPTMRALFTDWIWPSALERQYPHGLGTIEQPAILHRPD